MSSQERSESSSPRGRRGFLRTAGGVAAGTALFLAGCDSGSDGFTSNENPMAELSVSDNNPDTGEEVTFSYSISDPDLAEGQLADGITSVVIAFGDDDDTRVNLAPTAEGTVEHAYDLSGQYTATLTVQDNFSGEAVASVQIGVGVPPFTGVALDFSDNVDVLNYAYMLEQLEAAFYARVVAAVNNGTLSVDGTMEAYFQDLLAHERIHRDFLAAAIPMVGNRDSLLPTLETDFSSVDFSDLPTVLANAQLLEDTGVAAYNGAGIYLADDAELTTIAGKIVSVEARHAAAVRALIGPEVNAVDFASLADLGANADFSLDVVQSPQAVIDAVRSTGFITAPIEDPVGL